MVALAGVVVDDVEDDLEPRAVEGADHRLELAHLVAVASARRVAAFGREVSDQVVAPVVHEAAIDEVSCIDEVVHRHELHRGDAELLQVLERTWMRQPRVRSPQLLGNVVIALGETLHVQLVDDGVSPRCVRPSVVAPRKAVVDDDTLGHRVSRVERAWLEIVATERVAVQLGAMTEASRDCQRVGIEEQLLRVMTEPVERVVVAVDAQPVPLPRAHLVDVPMPHKIGTLEQLMCGCRGAVVVEQHNIHRVGRRRIYGEVGAFAIPGGAQRRLLSWPRLVVRARSDSGSSGRCGHDNAIMEHRLKLIEPIAYMLIVPLILQKLLPPAP